MPTGASLRGGDEMRARLARLAQKFPDEVIRALFPEIELEVTEVKRRVPVDKGPLRASVHQVGPTREGNKIFTMIAAGGTSAPYAIYVHEDLEAFHKVGQAKYIESVILEIRPYIAKRVAKRIELSRVLSQ